MFKTTHSVCEARRVGRLRRATAVVVISLLSVAVKAVAANLPEDPSAARSHPGLGGKEQLRFDSKAKVCRQHAREHGSPDRIVPGAAHSQRTVALFLDAVMYFKPQPGRGDVNGKEAGEPLAVGDRRDVWELGIIDTCMDSPRYY